MTIEKLIDILGNYTDRGRHEINRDSKIREDLMIKSVDIVNIIVSLEDEFGIEIEMSQLNPSAFQTVDSVRCLIDSLTES